MQLLERDRAVADAGATVDGVRRSGSGVVLAVAGEAGIGKTSLLQHLAASQSGMRVLFAGCEALFTPRPLGPFYDIAADSGEIDELLTRQTSRERLFPAILAALGREPTLLVIEDVHWADRATLDLLKHITRRITRTPVALVISYRDDEVGPHHPLVTVLGEAGRALKRILLSPLSRDAVTTLASRSGRSSDADDIHALTGGNPFFVTEVLATEDEGVPPTVRDAVLARTAKLSAAAREIVEIVSVAPARAERWLVDGAAQPTSAAVEEATTSGVLAVQGDVFAFRHELARRAIENSLSPIRRQSLHATVLALLRNRAGTPLARIAHHAKEACDAEAILHFAPLAAEEAIRADAHREAASHYRNAVEHAATLPDRERAGLLERLAYECYLTEQEEEALVRRREALEIWRRLGDRVREGDTLRWMSRLTWFAGRNAEARKLAAEAIAVLEALPPGAELAMAWSNQAQLHMLAHEIDSAVEWGERAIALARELGDSAILAHALNNVGTSLAHADDSEGETKLAESLRISLAFGHQEHAARAWCNLATVAASALDYERASRYVDEGLAYCAERDLDSWRLYIEAWRARILLEQGRWAEAADAAQAVLNIRGVAAISRIPVLAVLAAVRTRRGDPGAEPLLDEARDLARATGELQRIIPVACARAEAAWLRGDPAGTAEEAHAAFELAAFGLDRWQLGELAYWLSRAGALDRVPDAVAEPWRLHIAGDIAAAAAIWEGLGRPYDQARALADSDDRAHLTRALSILEHLGSGPLLRTVRQRLGIRGPRESTRANPAGLTTRELEILALLDEGLRNAEIAGRLCVSAKTVDHHVSAILSKLGARNRGEAARIFRSQYGEPAAAK